MINNTSKTGGISFLSVLFFIFLVLKLTDVITWSWWWVTAPIWMPFAFGLIVTIIIILAYFFVKMLK